MKSMKATLKASNYVAGLLVDAGFGPSLRRCENCGKRRAVYVKGDEYWCLRCNWGVLRPETKAANPNLWTGERR